MSKDASVPLYFITGFLGSGKTTLLNHALNEAAAKGLALGVIINEWGQVSIDSGLVPVESGQIELRELNDGQIFCSCLAGDFIQALELFSRRELDAVIVETSGMANPFPLGKMLEDLRAITGNAYDFKGMTALVDPQSFLELCGVINAVEEQVLASVRIIINKIDLATASEVAAARAKIESINPSAELIETCQAKIASFFAKPAIRLALGGKFGLEAFAKPAAGSPRPLNHVLQCDRPLEIESLADFMRRLLPKSLRIKSIAEALDGTVHYVDAVNDRVEDRVISSRAKGAKVVIIPKAGEDLAAEASRLWQEIFASVPCLSERGLRECS